MLITNEIVIEKAKKIGFDLVGFSKFTTLNNEVDRLKDWLGNGFNSNMSYMERNIEKRFDIKEILPSAETVISLALNYYVKGNYSNKKEMGKVSRYAWGTDYHYIIWNKLAQLISELKLIDKKFEVKSYVDTGPVMDKAWAVRSGIGWQGKNSNILNKQIGSWFFIATIITNYDFSESKIVTDHCGKCTACIDACPTNAIVEPYIIDANKCISNLTIENKGEIPIEFKGKFDGWIFGCDICQDVCPWNHKFSTETKIPEFLIGENREIDLQSVSKLTNSEFKKKYVSSPIYRAKAKGLKRNAEFLLEDNLKTD
ncbi:MAG: tRNA epoxyqueuosine(34) reductase QueG [Bacteroidetes bacterium]|nr:tRNA epoxyqueuosine(34) reductase QueG [Bacteroidota bacterium]MBU1116148.1 tRNA epoxyqueuosine(34) reductase QueG [Bacteroidota bacterium]MBU1800440.1 tRNA epoxyqueuosine(34) reductase QueG [Bacteroidota bacterium]